MEELWEPVAKSLCGTDMCTRLRVPGGWLVRTRTAQVAMCSEALVFLADKNHTWDIEKMRGQAAMAAHKHGVKERGGPAHG